MRRPRAATTPQSRPREKGNVLLGPLICRVSCMQILDPSFHRFYYYYGQIFLTSESCNFRSSSNPFIRANGRVAIACNFSLTDKYYRFYFSAVVSSPQILLLKFASSNRNHQSFLISFFQRFHHFGGQANQQPNMTDRL